MLAGMAAGLLSRPALAQANWPNRPVRIIVPYGPGSTPDTFMRLLQPRWQEKFGQPLVIENRAGAGGNIGAQAIATARPDGYTIGVVPVGVMTFNQFLYTSLPYNAARDLDPISVIYELPNIFVVRSDIPATTVAQFADWGKKRPQGVSCASNGPGNSSHLFCALLANRTNLRAIDVPFKGGASEALPAMLRGDVDFSIEVISSYLGAVREGQLRALAVTGAERWPTLPDVPTMAELGFAGFNPPLVWVALVAPRGTPPEVTAAIAAFQKEATADAGLQERFMLAGARIRSSTPQDLAARIQREQPGWRELIEISGAKL
ncbi:Bug family tripartite tricarboxylate transporter substrate binding protein [Roseomonas marmotae]|uniref:Bug family tripartite tricarboxylate transporter substrate binding protein n=1 Tax=Roseomonas marmotae TaxID=2768161 RepID=UPI001F3BA27E|nr:tripartite tricarboxylate transporter substrate binding protein [Roseomonas marmotae]